MEEIGSILRESRERLGLTLEEVERAIRIRTHHLEKLERGEFEALPSPVQARGFLRNYAAFLGLDADVILLDYADRLQSRRPARQAAATFDEATTRPSVQIASRRPRWLSSDLFVAAAITLSILAVFVWGVSWVMASLRERTEAAERASGLLVPTPTPTQLLPATEPIPLAEAVLPEAANSPPQPTTIPTLPLLPDVTGAVNVRILAEKRVWVSVIADGEDVFRGRLVPGDFVEAQGEQVVEVTTGNGGAVRAFYNGQDQGLLGALGQVVIRLWTLGGVLTPTPSQTSPPTETPTATRTPPPTP